MADLIQNELDLLDNTAVAALWSLQHEPTEHMGLLYRGTDGRPAAMAPQDSGDGGHSKARFVLPGKLLALYHNHPPTQASRAGRARDVERSKFSDNDLAQAKRLGVPSYIVAGQDVRRYVPGGPSAGEPVLAEIPWPAIAGEIRGLLRRDVSDPRGLLRKPK